MNSERFYFRRFLKNQAPKVPARKRLLETLEDRVFYDAAPVVTVDAAPATAGTQTAAKPFISEEFQFTATFQNAGTNDGYGPFVDVKVDKGMDRVGAPKYLGATLQVAGGVDNSNGATAVTYEHIYTKELITVAAGQEYWVYDLPFGSFVPDQPKADLLFTAVTDKTEGAIVGTGMNISVRGGFRFGADAQDNPQTDPVITGPLSVAVITPTVWSVSKNLIEHEDETATGENFPNTWEIYIDVAKGETLTNVTLKDILPDNVHFVAGSLTINGAAFSAQNVPDAANYTGGILDLSIASIVGVAGRDITISYQTYTPQFVGSGDVNGNGIKDAGDYVVTTTPVVDELTGAASSSTNGVNATAQYNPGTGILTVTDLVGSADDNVLSPNTDTLIDRSLAIQKGVSVVGGGSLLPSVDLSYQLNFQVSDFFQFEGIKIVDTLSDGQLFDPAQPVTFTWVEHGVATTANFALGSPTTATNYAGATNLTKTSYANLTTYFNNSTTTQVVDGYTVKGGETVLVFMVSAQMATVADSRAVGGRVNGATFGGTTGTIGYRTKVQENYINPTPGNPSIDLDDTITSGVRIEAEVFTWAGAATGNTTADGSGTTLTVPSPQLAKVVYAVNGVIGAVGAIAPGETMTYKMSLDLPTSDIENLLVTDFLPLPKFIATELASIQTISKTQFATLGAGYIPPAGKMVMVLADEVYDAKFGAGTHTSAINNTTLAPTNGALAAAVLAYDNDAFSAGNGGGINATANAFSIFIGSYDVDASVGDEVSIYFTVTATDQPMADGLLLTNQMQATYGNTGGASLVGQDIVQVIVEEPVVNIYKGVVTSTKAGGTTAGGLTFPPITSNGFTGTLTGATNAAAIGALNLSTGVLPDAGDAVGFAVVVQNTGRADAYDVTFSDVIPETFSNNFASASAFVAGTNLRVYDGAGVLQTVGVDYTVSWNNTTKTFSISLNDDVGQGALGAGKNTAGTDVTDGSNGIIVRYDLTLAASAQAGSTIANTATLTNYTGLEGGVDRTAENIIESATVTVASPLLSLTLTSSSVNETGNNGLDQAVIGETVTYTLTVTVPEGTMTNVKLTDLLPSGLAFQSVTGISTSSGVTVGTPPTAGATPANTTISNSGGEVLFNLGTVTNTNTNNAATETITITYTAVVLNIAGNQAGTTLGNNASLTYDYANVGTTTLPTPLPASGTGTLNTAAATTVKVVEPSVSVSNSISKDNVTYVDNATLTVIAGETVYYKVVLTNTGGLGAYDLSLYDRLPNVFNLATTSIVSVTSSSGSSDFSTANFAIVTDTAFGNNKPALVTDGALGGLAAGETVTIIVKSNIVNDAVAASTHPNGIQVRWTSLDDNRRSAEATDAAPTPTAIDGSATPIVRSTYNANAVERTGGEGPAGTLNNYASTDDLTATVFQVQPIAIVKAVEGTEINDSAGTNTNSATQAVIGEYVDYSITFSVPRGVATSFNVADVMQAGFAFVGFVDVTVGSNITTNVSGANTATASSLDDANITAVNLARLNAATTVAANGESFTINFDRVYNDQPLGAGDTYVAPQQITITYRAIVTDVVGNQAGTQINNTATVNYTTTNDSVAGNVSASSTPATPITVIEPVLQLSNTWSPAGPYDAGNAVTSTLVISHTAGSNTHAYELTFSDALPANLVKAGGVAFTSADLGTGITIVQSGGVGDISGQFEIVGGVLKTKSTADVDLLKGATITVTITGVLDDTVQAAQGVTNSATVTWSSINGAPTVSSSYTTADTERDGSGGVNDYTVTTAASLTVASPTVDQSWKDGTNSADDTSVASSTGANAVIGETVTFDILVTLPEGVSKNVRVQELLPIGLRYDSFQVITTAAGSTRLTADFIGTISSTPTVSGASADGSAASTVVFNFGDITTTDDNVTTNNSFVLRVTATVANISTNQSAVTRSPTAHVAINDTDGASNNGVAADITINDANAGNNPTVTIVEPTLTVVKGVSPSSGSIDAGDVLTYTITLSNTSGQTAYDVTLSDPISANLTVTAGLIGSVAGSSVATTGTATGAAGAFEIVDLGSGNFAVRSVSGANVDIPTGSSVTITFTATVVSSIGPAASITNTANVRWTSTDGTNTSERGGSDVSDTAPTSITQTSTSGALNNYALSSSIVTSVVNDISVVKSVVNTSLGGNDGVVTPGEIVTYQLTVTLPEGVTPDLQIRDALPPGMAYVPGSIVLVTTGYAGSVTAPSPTPETGVAYDNGTDVIFDFASITTTNDNVTTNNTFTFTFHAVALDVVSNDGVLPGQTTLTASATHNNGSGTTFAKSGGSVDVTVVEPDLAVTNALVITGAKDAGAAFTYTITVAPTVNATTGAYEVKIADMLPAELGAASFTATISDGVTTTDVSGSFDLTSNAFTTPGTVNLLLNTNGTSDQVLTITITGTLTSSVNPGETVGTSTSLAYTGLPGNVTAAGGFNPNTDVTTDHERAYTGSDTESFTAAVASFSKTLFSTDQAFTTGSNVAIGENVTYALLITLPEGTTPDLSILDALPPGLQYVSSSIVTTAAASGGLLTANFNGTLPAPTITGGATDGADVQFTFGSISVAGDNVTTNNSFVVFVTARVTNITGNQDGVVRAANATFDISGDGVAAATTADVNVTVVEPRVNVTKTVTSSTAGLDGGDSVTYKIVINNLATNGATADAFDVALSDVLPTGMLITAIGAPTLSGSASVDTALSGTGTNALGGTFDIPLGGSVTFTVTAQIPNTVTPGQALTSDLNVVYSSLDGTSTNERNGSGVTDPEDNTPPSDNAVLNNYAVGADATVTAGTAFSVTKSLSNSSLGNDTSLNVVVGETLTYQLAVSVMEGTTSNLSLIDTLPRVGGVNRLVYVPGSLAVTDANGVTINGLTASYDATANQLTITATSVVNPGGSNSTTNDAATVETDTFYITYQTQVADVTANSSGATLTNDVDATATGVTADNNNAVTVTVRQPALTIDKSFDVATADAGDVVAVTIALTNGGNASAYDTVLTDTINASIFDLSTVTAVTTPTGWVRAFNSTTGLVTYTADTTTGVIAAGDTVTFTFTAKLVSGLAPGTAVSNTAGATTTTLPGTVTGERTTPSVTDSATLTVPATLGFTKTLVSTSSTSTTGNNIAIGENATFRLGLTIQQGVTSLVTLRDTLPAGLAYQTGTAVFRATTTGATAVGATSNTVYADGDVIDASDLAYNSGTGAFTVNLKTVTIPATTSTVSGGIAVDYTAKVTDVVGNAGGTTLTNSATASADRNADGDSVDSGETTAASTITLTVVEPVLEITKTFSATTGNAGDVVTTTIAINNAGTGVAFDTNLQDVLSGTQFDRSSFSVITVPSGWTSSYNATTGVLSVTDTNATGLAVGASVTITFSAKLNNTLAPGTTVSNSASATTTTLAGVVVGERSEAGVSSTATLTVPTTLTLTKSLVGTDSTGTTGSNVTIGESATFRLLVTLGEGQTSVLTFSDTLPAGLAYQSGTAIFRATTTGATAVGAVSGTAYTDGTAINASDLTYNSTTGALGVRLTNVVIPGTTSTGTGQISLDYTAKVSNVVGNVSGTTLTNSATVSADRNGDGDLVDAGETSAVGTHTLTVREPTLTIAKDFDVTNADAGDVITTTIVVTNTGGSPAYDTVISDALNGAQFDLSTFSLSSAPAGWTSSFNATTGALSITDTNAAGIAASGSVTITFTTKLLSSLAPGTAVSNTASVTTTSISGVATGERTTPTVTDSATLTGSSTLSLVKSVNATSESSTTGNNVAIGETVTFRLGVTLQQGVTSLVTLRDTLPTGLSYQTGTAVFRATTTDATAVGAVSGTAYSDGVAINAADLVYNATTGAFTVSLATVSIPSAAGISTGGFAIDYTTLVRNVLGNSGDGTATTLVNSATVSADRNNDGDTVDAGETTTTSTQTLTVVEPVMTFDQSALTTTTGLDAGDTIQYQVTFTNTGTATAHDVTFADTLPTGVVITAIGTPTLAGGATTDTALSGLNTGAIGGEFTVPVGGSVTFTYTVTLQNTVTPTTDYTSAATLNWSSIDGTNTNERTGADGTQGGGTLNDYRLTDTVTASTASTFALGKTANKTTASIGELITYSLQLTLNEGTTQNVVLADTLPVVSGALQLVFVPGSAAITYGTTASSITGSVTPVVSGAQNQTLTFSLGDVVVPAGAGANTVTVTYQVRVANIVTNASGDVEVNSASGSATGVTSDTGNTASVTLTEPALSIDTSITSNTSNVDAGDTVTYQIVVTHLPASTSGAFDLSLIDTLPGELEGYTIVSATIGATNVASSFGISGTSLTTTGDVDLALGQTLTITVSGKAKDANVPGTVIANSASVGYTSQNGTVTGERSYSETDAAPNVVTVGSLAVGKTADKTTATIGEIVTYTVTVTIGEGTTTVTLDDTLPAGLTFVANSAVLNTPSGWTIAGFTNNSVDQTLTILNPGNVDAPAGLDVDSFTITYQAVVTNVTGNQAGVTLTNTLNASADLNNDGDVTDTGETDNNNQAAVTVTEPQLTIDTSITTNTTNVDAGDTVTYQIVVTHAAGSTAGAFDLNLTDTLPSQLAGYTIVSATIGATDVSSAFGITGTSLTTTGNVDLAQGQTLTITVSGKAKDANVPGTVIANSATVTYTSLDGVVTGERGSAGGGVNDYTATDAAPNVVTVGSLTVAKTADKTAATIGEVVTYTVTVTVAEGTTTVSLDDTLPTGLVLIANSGVLNTPTGWTITGFNANAVDQALTVVNTNATDGASTLDTASFTITYQAVVTNTLANQSGVTLINDVDASADLNNDGDTTDAGETDNNNQVTVTVTEPHIAITKTVDDTTPHLGDTITYTLVLTNDGTSGAFAVSLSDVLPAGVTIDPLTAVSVTPAGSATTTTAVAVNGTNTALGGTFDIPVGGTITIVYQAVVSSDPAIVGGTFGGTDDVLSGVVAINWSSLAGTVTGERTGVDGVGPDATTLNNYANTLNTPITVVGADLSLVKDDGITFVIPGQSWTYTLTVTNDGTDTATGVVLTDTVPPETTITAIRIGGVDTAFTIVSGVITLNLADIAVGDNVVVSIDATLDAAVDIGRETLANTASVTHDDVEATPLNNTSTDTDDLTAAPDIAVDKAVTSVNGAAPTLNGLGQPIVAAGDTVIYTIVLTNNGDQDSVIKIADAFPGVVLDLSQVVIDDTQTGVTAVIDVAAGTITWSGVSLDAGQTITITLETKAFDPQLQALDNFTNTVVVTNVNPANTSEDGTQWQDDEVADLAATPDLVVTKVNSTDRIGLDDVFTYTITLKNAGNQNATNVTVVDDLPPYVQLISASGNYIYDPVARTITWLAVDNPDLAVVDGGSAETLTFTVTVKLPVNSIAFGDLTNTVRAFDDGTNGLDVNPADNVANNTTQVLGFLYDSMQNFSTFSVFDRIGDERPWYQLGQPIEVYRDAILPIAPIYSGSAEPGSTLEIVMQNANGDIIGRQTVMADTGGNWMASFPGAIVKDYPQSVMITQTPSNTQTESSQGYNMRPYYATAVNAGHFFKQSLNVTRLLGETATATTAALAEANNNPIGFNASGSPYEVLASPGQPSGK